MITVNHTISNYQLMMLVNAYFVKDIKSFSGCARKAKCCDKTAKKYLVEIIRGP